MFTSLRYRQFIPQWFSVMLAIVIAVFAQETPLQTEELLNMDLEQLLSMQVSATTKTDISLQRSPGIVRVFTREDIERYGLRTLADALAYVPGMQLQKSYKNSTGIWIRGVQTRYNNKVLLLIDGVPIRECYYGQFDIEESVPLDNVERIEVINGPGSVLYGTNAFAGVISIKTASTGIGAKVGYVGGAGNDTYKDPYGLVNVQAHAEFKGVYLFGEFAKGSLFAPELTSRNGYPYVHENNYQQITATLKYSNPKLGLSAVGTYNDIAIPDIYTDIYSDATEHRSPLYASINFERNLKNTGKIKINPYIQFYNLIEDSKDYLDEYDVNDSTTVELPPEEKILAVKGLGRIQTLLWGTDAEFTGKLPQNNTLTAGLSFVQDHSIKRFPSLETEETEFENGHFVYGDWTADTSYKLTDDASRVTTGLFAQDVWEINKNFLVAGGVRYDILSDFDDQFSARIGLTAKSPFSLYGKLLAGTAYRVPLLREYLKDGMENPDLQPEHIFTSEAQVGYLAKAGDMNLTYYYNRFTDYIGQAAIVKLHDEVFWDDEDDHSAGYSPDEYYMNFKEMQIMGLEWYSQFYLFKGLGLGFTATYVIKGTENMGTSFPTADDMSTDSIVNTPASIVLAEDINQGEQDLKLLSKYSATLRLSYKFKDYIAGANLRYASEQPVPNNWHSDDDLADNLADQGISLNDIADNNESYWEADVYLSAKIWKGLGINAAIRNILGTQSYAPNFSKITEYDVERPGRKFEAALSYSF